MNCASSQRKQGILVPECPPQNELELHQGEREYFMYANFDHDTYKTTYDMLLGLG